MSQHHTHRYQARCQWQGETAMGYESYVRAHDGDLPPATSRIELSADPAFRGDAARANPEQLLVLAAASCQLLSFLAVAARARIDVRGYDDEAEGFMPEEVAPARVTEIRLRPRITVGPGPSPERLANLVELAHRQCYIANSLTCAITVEPRFIDQDYAFGDTAAAAARLELLAEIFNPSSRGFLIKHAPARVGLAVDLGCGPGATTAMLAATTGATRTIGLDASPAFLTTARTTHADAGITFVNHDLTRLPFPAAAAGAQVGFARFLLAHLPDRTGALAGWLAQLHPLGVLVIEETEAIHTDNPVFSTYLELAEQLLAARGATLYSGALVNELAGVSPDAVLDSRICHVDVAANRAAELFAGNLAVWRTDPAVTASAGTLDHLARELGRLRASGSGESVRWSIRQLALTPTDSLPRVRAGIDDIDRQLAQLLARRGRWVARAAAFKRDAAEVRGSQSRIEDIMTRARANAEDAGGNPDVVEDIFRLMIEKFIGMELRHHAREH